MQPKNQQTAVQLNQQVKDELKKEGAQPDSSVTESSLQDQLGSYYLQQRQSHEAIFKGAFPYAALDSINISGVGETILDEVKKLICGALNDDNNRNKIVDLVVDALTGLIPGGVVIKPIAKAVVNYILKMGVNAFCSTNPQ